MSIDISPQYVAGFFDGEGYAGIYSWDQGRSYTLKAQLTNTHRETLERIQEVYGGHINAHHRDLLPNHRSCYNLGWHAENARAFLLRIYPYLILKRERVEVLLKFPINDRMLGYKSEKMIEVQRLIYERVKQLNQRGRPYDMVEDVPEQYKNLAVKEHEEHLRKKALAIQLSKEHPDWGYKRIGQAMGVSGTMAYKYLKPINDNV